MKLEPNLDTVEELVDFSINTESEYNRAIAICKKIAGKTGKSQTIINNLWMIEAKTLHRNYLDNLECREYVKSRISLITLQKLREELIDTYKDDQNREIEKLKVVIL